jgi:hypothetical protein
MPWLVVLGKSTWRLDHHRVYGPGVHEVDQEVAERATAAPVRSLLVLDEEPIVDRPPDQSGPLTMEDLKRGTPGVQLAQPERGEAELIPIPREHRCLHCPLEFPSSGALLRHVEFHHS